MPDPLLIAYDGSEDAKYAIRSAAGLLAVKNALVVTVWHPTSDLGAFAWYGAGPNMVNFSELDRAGAEAGGRVAEQGAQIARNAGLHAESLAIEATPPVWKTIVDTAALHDAAAIVMGSRGLTGLRSMLLGSVSNAVVHHADRPTLVIHRPDDDADHSAGDRREAADDRAVSDVREQRGDRRAPSVVAQQEARGLE
jgi:nucleotide-binding universal stress UspA family protein